MTRDIGAEVEAWSYERGRVYCTAAEPWDQKRAPVTHTGTNDVRVDNGALIYMACEFCGCCKNIIGNSTKGAK